MSEAVRVPTEAGGAKPVELKPARRPSAADLKFLHRMPQALTRNFKSKSGTRIIKLFVPICFRSSCKSLLR
jgi:hypothetical protein